MVVLNSSATAGEVASVTELLSLCEHEIGQPGGRVALALNDETRVSNHVDDDNGLDLILGVILRYAFCKVTASL